MASHLLAATFEVTSPLRAARFWGELLGRDAVELVGGVLLPGDNGQLGLAFVPSRTGKGGANRMHVHLTSISLTDQEQTVEAARLLGAHHVDVGQRPDEGHVVLTDPQGNEFCVVEPGNAFLAGCGFLGELACDGSRGSGLFWSRALGWPLVWDHDEETAIQSRAGGTKVAWGGAPEPRRDGPDRQRFDLVCDEADQDTEVERLRSLGARVLGELERGATALADPDGFEFRLHRHDA